MLKENLVILRNIHGYSQEEIAEKINISRQAYAKWESGATVPDIEKCSLLAAVYGVTIDSLIKTETADGIGMIPPAPKNSSRGVSTISPATSCRRAVPADDCCRGGRCPQTFAAALVRIDFESGSDSKSS